MSYQTASIIDVLLAYGSHGGGLYAAYRHPDNPLLLTDVRWQGPAGEALETHRGPEDLAMVREEREAWAQVALRSTTLRPDSIGPRAPWLQAPFEPREAHELATRAQRAREASAPPQQAYSSSSAGFPSNGPLHGSGYGSAPGHTPMYNPGAPSGFAGARSPEYSAQHARDAYVEAMPASQSYESQGGYGGYPSNLTAPGLAPEHSQTTGAWSRDAFQQRSAPSSPQSMAVVVCVEIEMPTLMAGSPQDFTKDFARDVALNFNLAARTVPQTRETRGWMHGARMTLGALMSLAAASRAATQGEMEHARDSLAAALARRTLPYVQMRFADMQEWDQGVPLPE